MESKLPWVEKYRPKKQEDLINEKNIMVFLKNYTDNGTLPNMLLTGPPGTGKTSTIFTIAKNFFKNDFSTHVLELNASDERGINVVRNNIKIFTETKVGNFHFFNNNQSDNKIKIKLVILDEADSMTKDAQSALRRIIEKSNKTVKFCLIGNNEGKIIPALHSRCLKIKFKPLSYDLASNRLNYILNLENVECDELILKEIFMFNKGDMRKVLNMLQNWKLNLKTDDINRIFINEDNFYKITGLPNKEIKQKILNSLLNDNFNTCLNTINYEIKSNGIGIEDILNFILEEIIKLNFNQNNLMNLLIELGNVQEYESKGMKEEYLILKLISVFQIFRNSSSN